MGDSEVSKSNIKKKSLIFLSVNSFTFKSQEFYWPCYVCDSTPPQNNPLARPTGCLYYKRFTCGRLSDDWIFVTLKKVKMQKNNKKLTKLLKHLKEIQVFIFTRKRDDKCFYFSVWVLFLFLDHIFFHICFLALLSFRM